MICLCKMYKINMMNYLKGHDKLAESLNKYKELYKFVLNFQSVKTCLSTNECSVCFDKFCVNT